MKPSLQRGLTLTELMIGLTISLLITLIIQNIYTNTKNISRVDHSIARLQENGRFGIDMLQTDIRMAGFLGCRGQPTAPVSTLNGTAYQYRYAQGIYGFRAISGGAWSPALDNSISSLTPAPLAGTDAITVWVVDEAGLSLSQSMTSTTDTPRVGSNDLFDSGDIALIANCNARALFQITETDPQTTGLLSHAAGTLPAPGNGTNNLQHVFDADATVYRVTARTYYIAPSTRKPGTNSLWRYCVPTCYGERQLDEITEGVDDLHIEYGIDTDNDSAANRYIAADTVTTGNLWPRVVSVKLQLLLTSTQNNVPTSHQPYSFAGETKNSTDRRLRVPLTTVVALRNRVP